MKKSLCVALGLLVSSNVWATSGVDIINPWARATPNAATVGAAYLELDNKGSSADALIGVASPVAQKVELHSMTMNDGVMQMRQVERLPLNAGAQVVLKPGSYHIMLIGLKQPLVVGSHFPLTLRFEKAGEKQVEVSVAPLSAMSAPN